jgi:hypothetical protein
MIENWQSQDELDHLDWRADRNEGYVIGLVVILGVGVVVAFVSRYVGASDTLIAEPFVPEWPV